MRIFLLLSLGILYHPSPLPSGSQDYSSITCQRRLPGALSTSQRPHASAHAVSIPGPIVSSEVEILACSSLFSDGLGFKWPALPMHQKYPVTTRNPSWYTYKCSHRWVVGRCLEEFLCSSEHLFI